MSPTLSTLLLRNLHDVFGEIDAVKRRAAIVERIESDERREAAGRAAEETWNKVESARAAQKRQQGVGIASLRGRAGTSQPSHAGDMIGTFISDPPDQERAVRIKCVWLPRLVKCNLTAANKIIPLHIDRGLFKFNFVELSRLQDISSRVIVGDGLPKLRGKAGISALDVNGRNPLRQPTTGFSAIDNGENCFGRLGVIWHRLRICTAM